MCTLTLHAQFVDAQSKLISIERILELTQLEHEANNEAIVLAGEAPLASRPSPPPNWPHMGRIQLVNVSMRYRHDMPEVLHNLNIEIEAKEKVRQDDIQLVLIASSATLVL